MNIITPESLEDLRSRVRGEVSTDETVRAEASYDSSPRSIKAQRTGARHHLAGAVVTVLDTEDVVAVMHWANAHRVPVVARGGGSGVVGAGIPQDGGVVLDMSGLNHIGEVDVTNRLVTVGAGAIGADVEAAVEPLGLGVGHYPQSFYLASVAGWVTMRGSGTFSSLHGNIEDRLADLEVVLPTGEVLQTSSMPRASEGPDLKQLMVGSEGMFGVITKVTLRLIPVPESRIFDSYLFQDFESSLVTARRLLEEGVRPAVLRIYDPIEAAAKHARFAEREGWMMVLAFDGSSELTLAQQSVAARLAAQNGGEGLGPEPGVHWEQRRFDYSWSTDALATTGGMAEAIEMTATWDRLPALYEAATAAAAKGMQEVMGHVSHVYDQGGCLYVISSGRFGSEDEAVQAYSDLYANVMEAALGLGVRISHHHGVGSERAPWLERSLGSVAMDVLGRIKHALDPQGVMNPGKFGL